MDVPEHVQRLLDGLRPKMASFVLAYCGPAMGSPHEAARMAGYKHPHNGVKLLKHPEVADAIAAWRSVAVHEAAMGRAEAIELLASIARGDCDGPPPEVKDRIAAIRQLAKMEGWEKQSPKQHRHLHAHLAVPLEQWDVAEAKAELGLLTPDVIDVEGESE